MSAYVSSTRVEERIAKRASLNAGSCDVPVVVESAQGGKAHFSVLPRDATVAQLTSAVRRLDGVDARKAVSLAVAQCAVAPTTTLGELHDACKQADDGMLYVTYTAEAAMGATVNVCGMTAANNC
ncbi:microtubule associated protein-like protein [Leptomonas pyrrhocoris]|uniref:Microtubule associated protein-like protein n=1 Tax=Leptomonas pyrrhocoris TaxID=157538 RepID=A0A0N0VEA7_LEPPY|nr:microtubule associated protein-like protein [Leptomonas pyrrhocoris]XP_015655920.1 microtubule associated protein-like protein [Leptomonas pyrrhocoris]XP_015655921.1 microtubule associated protein-like protein [Leptomonas pyrrhocoris]XP_015655922.1 microtubule associated protein-like protein [Leptomonas pyrrhocoris]KPA77480.1 microtubule associated protein-like protein [Leptomonas pyrrhocoris]KPA77481.1 microtubule associated protein-like protein [Leptomonas pyrrhocoris]KPA77482.1 microtub|eukprot:XP_015655919.1 microtubule associated protein-like protein [Leptomonas pyrrhocoris]